MTLYTNFRWGLTGERQAMLVDGGLVVDRASNLHAIGCEVIDLKGKFLLPGFIDCHCHVMPAGFDFGRLDLGTCQSHEQVLDLLRDAHRAHPEGWLLATQYNQTNLGGEHLTRDQLDTISSTRPIVLDHVSGHASVVNSAALMAAGVTENTPDPEGGTYERDAQGRLNGLLLEDAKEAVDAAIPQPEFSQMVDAILLAGERMRAMGVTCASDMMTGYMDLEKEFNAYEEAARRGCQIETRLFVQWKAVFGPRGMGVERFRERIASLKGTKVAGIKLFADGALSSGTAAIYGKFAAPPIKGRRISKHAKPAQGPEGVEVDGQLIYSPARLAEMVQKVHEAGFMAATHAIGDYASDLVMDAYEATGEPSRHRLEHAMMLSDRQVERLAKDDITVTFQPEFLAKLTPAYKQVLTAAQIAHMKRTRSLIDAGVRLGFSSDVPVVSGDPWVGINAASNRPADYAPVENCSRKEAIERYTAGAADANGDQGQMGRLAQGEMAHFNLFELNPLQITDPRLSADDDDLRILAA